MPAPLCQREMLLYPRDPRAAVPTRGLRVSGAAARRAGGTGSERTHVLPPKQ